MRGAAMGKTLGVVTVGQTPCTDVLTDIAPIFGPEVDIVQAGALDGLGREQIRDLAVTDPLDTVVARLRDGSVATVDRHLVAVRLQAGVRSVEERGADLTLILSTAPLAAVRARGPVLYPSRVLVRVVESVLSDGRLGVVVPLRRQREQAERKWQAFAGRMTVEAMLPYAESDWGDVARVLVDDEVRLAVLDGIHYTREMKAELAALTRLPVVCARILAARVAAELI